MNIITILITLCRLSTSYRRNIEECWSRALERTRSTCRALSRYDAGYHLISSIGILRKTHMRPFTSTRSSPRSRRIDVIRPVKSHLRSLSKFFFQVFSFSPSLSLARSLSYQLGSGQMCVRSVSTLRSPHRSASIGV